MIFGTFLRSPLHWYLISRWQKNPIFLFLCFQGLPELQIRQDFNHDGFSSNKGPRSRRNHRGRPLGPKVGPWRDLIHWPCHGTHLAPRGSPRLRIFMDAFVPTEKPRHIFPRFYRGGSRGGNLLLLREGADPAASSIRGRHRRGNRLLHHLHTSLA